MERWKWVQNTFCHHVETLESLSKLVEQGVSVEIKAPHGAVLYWREAKNDRWMAIAPSGSPEMWADWSDTVMETQNG